MLKVLLVLKEFIFMDNNDILYYSFTLISAEIYLYELDILLTFHYMIFKSRILIDEIWCALETKMNRFWYRRFIGTCLCF